MATWPTITVQADFQHGPNAGAQTWTNLQSAGNTTVVGFHTKRGRQYELNKIEAGTAEIGIIDYQEYLNPANTGSPWNSGSNSLVPYRQCQIQANWNPGVQVDSTSTAPASAASRTTMTWAHTVGATANLLTVAIPYAGGGTVTTSSVTFNGVVATGYTRIQSSAGANNRLVDLWYLKNPTVGTFNIVVTQSGSNDCDAAAISWINTDPTTPLGTAVTSAAATGTTNGPLSPVGGQYVLAAASVRSTGTVTASGSPTVVLSRVGGAFSNMSAEVVYSPVTYNPTFSGWTTNENAAAAVAILPNAAGTTYNLFTGYVERFPVAWDSAGFRGVRNLTCVDPMALLNRTRLTTPTIDAAQTSGAVNYFPLDDVATTGFRDVVTGAPCPWSAPFYAQDNYNIVTQQGETSPFPSPDGQKGLAVTYGGPNTSYRAFKPATAIAGNLSVGTMAAWVRIPAAATTASVIAYCLDAADARLLGIQVATATAPAFSGLSGGASATTHAWVPDGQPHHFAMTCDGVAAPIVYVDGVALALVSSSAPSTTGTPDHFEIQIVADLAGPISIAGMLYASTALTASQIADLAAAGSGWAGEPAVYNSANPTSSKGRVRHLLDVSGWTGYGSTLDNRNTAGHTGQTPVAAAGSWGGSGTKTQIENVVTTEDGLFFVDASGRVVVRDRQSMRANSSSSYTFGDGAGELPYEGDVSYSLDPQYVYNDAIVSNSDGSVYEVQDSASAGQYGVSTLSLSTGYYNPTDASLRAQWSLSKYKQPTLRLEQITLNPAANNSLFPAALGMEIGTVVTVKRRNAGLTMSGTFFVESIEHDVKPGQWLTHLWLSPTSLAQGNLILDDATYGVLDSFPISN